MPSPATMFIKIRPQTLEQVYEEVQRSIGSMLCITTIYLTVALINYPKNLPAAVIDVNIIRTNLKTSNDLIITGIYYETK
jgi:hypothetical protein